MEALKLFLTIPLIAFLAMPFMSIKWRGIVAYLAVILNAILSSYIAINVLGGENYQFIFSGNAVTGEIPVRIDALSAWFILIINFTILTGGLYGIYYMREYLTMRNSITLHVTAFILLHTALLSLCGLQNSIVFLLTWEIMALSAFVLVIFEHNKVSTIKAGINFLIQSHVSIIFLLLGFVWVAAKTGSYDFLSISQFTHEHGNSVSLVLFIFLFIGFAIKAGFVPFHTWLPYAHPAAPAHVSGIMSGVLIKIGIYGILRVILLQNTNLEVIGYIIIAFSAISGIYGVMLAILQHNLKRLLAYHSIENIGIIGLGIGIGCVGLGTQNLIVASLGFAGALLHTLNHSLFKSQLFFSAGIVYQATHTVQIEKLGGLIKKMPQTAFLFLIAALAISGLPPFNGFISEFLIYSG
jgi:formate hydrogenlyase subunit 3/multisubunit Na+/H+ antiporter MnhD subunit